MTTRSTPTRQLVSLSFSLSLSLVVSQLRPLLYPDYPHFAPEENSRVFFGIDGAPWPTLRSFDFSSGDDHELSTCFLLFAPGLLDLLMSHVQRVLGIPDCRVIAPLLSPNNTLT